MRPIHEEATLRLARERFADWRTDEVNVTDLRLEGGEPFGTLVIIFTHRDRPGCEFGSRWPLKDEANPEIAVDIFEANLDEQIDAVGYGLPRNCRAGEVTWV